VSTGTLNTGTLSLDDIELGNSEFWARPWSEREATFSWLRANAPISFHKEFQMESGPPPGNGFWAITRWQDVWEVSRHPQIYSSAKGITWPDQVEELLEFFGSMIVLDPPRHTKLRLLVQKGFTPRMISQVEDYVRQRARKIVSRIAEMGTCDFVAEVAAPLPLEIICDMMGIPLSDAGRIFECTNLILGAGDPDITLDFNQFAAAAYELFEYAQKLGQERLENPKDDITSALMQAEVDGERLTKAEFGSFFILLAVAGNETTRNAISHGLHALTENPDQRRILTGDLPGVLPTAVEEIVRWASPVIHMRRTATEDARLGDQDIKAGDKVVMFYNSANRDETVFERPHEFDVRRKPNEHVAFGAGGPHFCLGANLARREITVMFDELLRSLPGIRSTTEPAVLRSGFINGIKRLGCEFTPKRIEFP